MEKSFKCIFLLWLLQFAVLMEIFSLYDENEDFNYTGSKLWIGKDYSLLEQCVLICKGKSYKN